MSSPPLRAVRRGLGRGSVTTALRPLARCLDAARPLGLVAGPVPVGPSTIRMGGGTRTPSRRCWRPVRFQLRYAHSMLMLSCCAIGRIRRKGRSCETSASTGAALPRSGSGCWCTQVRGGSRRADSSHRWPLVGSTPQTATGRSATLRSDDVREAAHIARSALPRTVALRLRYLRTLLTFVSVEPSWPVHRQRYGNPPTSA